MPQSITTDDEERQEFLSFIQEQNALDQQKTIQNQGEFSKIVEAEVSPETVQDEARRRNFERFEKGLNLASTLAAGGGPIALGATAGLQELFGGGQSETESRAGITAAATDMLLSRFPGGQFLSDVSDMKGLFKQGAKRTAISSAAVLGEQLIESAADQQEIAGALSNAFFIGTLPEGVSTGLGVGIARILGPSRGSDIVAALSRLRDRFPAFRKQFGLQVEAGGFGQGLTDFFQSIPGVRGGLREQTREVFEPSLQTFREFGGIGQEAVIPRLRTPQAGKDIKTILEQTNERISAIRPFRRINEEGAEILTERALQGGDLIAINRDTGQILTDFKSVPKGFEGVTVDPQQIKELRQLVRQDPGSVARAIGFDKENMDLVLAVNEFMTKGDAEIIRRSWLQELLNQSLEFRSKSRGGINLNEAVEQGTQLEPDDLIRLNPNQLKRIWDKKNSEKAALVLGKGDLEKGKETVQALDDVVKVLRDLDIGGEAIQEGRASRVLSFIGNKLTFASASAGAVGIGGAAGMSVLGPTVATAAGGAALGFSALLGLSGLVNLVALNPRTAKFLTAAAKGDRDASRAFMRAVASSGMFRPSVLSTDPLVVDFEMKSLESAVEERMEERVGEIERRTGATFGTGALPSIGLSSFFGN